MNQKPNKLTDAAGLLAALFSQDSRPSIRWLRSQTAARNIRSYKIGHLRFFDPEEVREDLRRNLRVEARTT